MMGNKSFIFRFDDVEVREAEFSLTKAGKVSSVEPKAFRALLFLLRNPQRLVSKEELVHWVWGDTAVADGSLTRCIWLLRRLLGDNSNEPRYIETVATVGYRFIRKVEVTEDAPGELKTFEEPDALSGISTKTGHRQPAWGWALAGGGVLALCFAGAVWYLRLPLPSPRVAGYKQITHDGHKKYLAGTDGSRLYLTRTNENDFYFGIPSPESISQVAMSGGESAQIPVAVPSSHLEDVSADGSNLLVFSMPLDVELAHPLWSVRTLGGQARKLGEAVAASFSPDGNSVAYSTPEGEIWLVRNDGSEAHKLASVKDYAYGFTWSPDGKFIRFGMDGRIWEMSSGGSGPHEVLPGWRPGSLQCCGRWTPDGKFFLFLHKDLPLQPGGEIWALDERRGLFRRPPAKPIQLAGGPISWGRPFPGKDGKTIFAEGQTPRGELSRFDPKTKQFQPFLGGISAQGVVFSKDGKSIAYVSFPEGSLWKANRDGSNPVQLTDPPMLILLPRWSPDGTQIAFWAYTPDVGEGNYTVSSEGGSPPKLLPGNNGRQEFPYWSPDGRKIAFNDNLPVKGRRDKEVIRILDLDTRQAATVPGPDDLNAPRFSPDGRHLLAGAGDQLMIFDFRTQQWSELGRKGLVDSAEWSTDGQSIYVRCLTGDPGVFRISVKTGEAEKIVDLKNWHDAGWYGRYMGLDPTDAPLLLRDIGSDDIYALTLDVR
jgi:DNA-binding winged helix-turn-helix (wHTH) protein/Tol biopolymer transport system component